MTKPEISFLNYISGLQQDKDIPSWSGYMPNKKLSDRQMFFDLPSVVRALMVTDGTVTMALEVIYKEPIEVELLDQHNLILDHDIKLLDMEAGEEVFYREVLLRGKQSRKTYVRAYSLLKKNTLSATLWEQLRNREIGMGVVLRNAAQGSFRKVLHMGLGDINTGASLDEYVHRTYSVNIDEAPAILITEVFTLSSLVDD